MPEQLRDVVVAAAATTGGVTHAGTKWTFAELFATAATTRLQLARRGAGPGTVVALVLPAGPELITSIMAVADTGACYQYVDPSWPVSYQDDLVARGGARLGVRYDGRVVSVGEVPGAEDTAPGDVACLISTSGTTGGARVVGLTHQGVLHLVRDAALVRLTSADRLLALAHPGFGAALWEIWAALDAGAELIIPAERRQSLDDLVAATAGASVAHFSAGVFRQFSDDHLRALDSLRLLMTGGDTVAPQRFRAAHDLMAADVVACYGCTENTVFTSVHLATDDTRPDRPVPLGAALNGTGVHVLAEDLRPVETGEAGELYVTGTGLAFGYLNDAEATGARFLSVDGMRAFRTGDFARRRDDGTYELTGRRDRQVQVRGYRVELADVENRLRGLASVHDVCALQVDGPGGESELVAALTASSPPSESEVRSYLRDRLPAFMVPDRVVALDAFPLTERGKLDRRALADVLRAPVAEPAAPAGAVARIWQDVLGREEIPEDVAFVELGGHSLRATKVLSRILEEFEVRISMQEFYEASTVREIAQLVAVRGGGR